MQKIRSIGIFHGAKRKNKFAKHYAVIELQMQGEQQVALLGIRIRKGKECLC